jgi:exopolysaccharide production protein ExoZ
MTAERERIVSLQILRFVAAMMVALCHARYLIPLLTNSIAPTWFWNGAVVGVAGVDLFFVISGFVIAMTGPFARPRPSAKLFFWRRWRRVAPVYFVISLPFIVNAWRAGPLSPDRLAATFLFWPAAGAKIVFPYVGVGWTLCYEMAFYSAMALLLIGGRTKRNLIISGSVIAGLIALRLLSDAAWLRYLVNPMFLEFGAGVALAYGRTWLARLPMTLGVVFLLAGIGAFAFEAALNVGDVIGDPWLVLRGRDLWPRLALYGLPSSIIVAGALICEPWCRGRLADLLAKGGDASYAIYLTHSVAMAQVAVVWLAIGAPRAPFLIVAAGLAAALAVGLLVYRVIEKPILRDLKRLSFAWPPWRTDPVVETAT